MSVRKITKMFANTMVRGLDIEKRTAEYIISSDEVDRMGEIVDQSWDLENYKKNPIVLWGHDPSQPNNVLGNCIELETREEGGRNITVAKVQFAEEGTSEGVDTVWKLVRQGILKTVSVGFISKSMKSVAVEGRDGEVPVLADNELLEFSIVPIPANPNAVALAYGDGSISENDARWLAKQYKAETEFLERSLYDTMTNKNAQKTHIVNENQERGVGMSDDDITKLSEAIAAALEPKFEAILNAVEGDEKKPEDKPEDEKPEDKPEAGSTIGDDKPAEDEGDEDDEQKPKKSAKAEQGDEAGALEDENEELDEEAQKAYLAELEKTYKEIERGE